MILLLNGITGFGITTSLLRNHSIDKNSSYYYSTITIFIVQIILLILAFFPNNYLSKSINIEDLDIKEHFVFYLSAVFINIFVFNRAFMNAENNFLLMLKTISAITIIRFLGLAIFYLFNINDTKIVLISLFVFPFIFEIIYFSQKLVRSCNSKLKYSKIKYITFMSFSIKTFLAGSIFIATGKLFLIHLKDIDINFASVLAFSSGFVGIIGLFNFSFTNYFIGKLNSDNLEDILLFKSRIKKYTLHYFALIFLVLIGTNIFLYFFYSMFDSDVLFVASILICQTGVISYFGFTNILTKSFDLLYYDLAINILRFICVFVVIKVFSTQISFLHTLLFISIIMITGEIVLSIPVNSKIAKLKNGYSSIAD